MNYIRPKSDGRILVGIVVFLLAILAISFSNYTVTTGSVGVLATFGKFDEKVVEPGLHFKIPGVQQVYVLDTKMQTIHYIIGGNEERSQMKEEGVEMRPMIEVLDSKNLTIGIELTVQFTPDIMRASNILGVYGKNYVEKLINPMIRDTIRDISSQYPAEDFSFKRSRIGDEMKQNLIEKFIHLPFLLNDVQLRNIHLPKIVKMKIEEVQLAKQEEQRLAMILKQKEQELEITIMEGKKRIEQQTRAAEAAAREKRIAADAEAYSIEKQAVAMSEANAIIAKSLTPHLIHYEVIKKWNGKYPQFLLTGREGQMIVQLPSPSLSKESEEVSEKR